MVRAFARSAADISISDPKLEKVRGNALRSNDVTAAVKGTNAVIQALGVGLGDLFGPVHLFSDATRILVAAMRAQGVKRLISVTGFGAGDSRVRSRRQSRQHQLPPVLPFRFFLGRAYDDKEDSALDWTIVRPGLLTNGGRTGRYKVLKAPSQWRNGNISREDVADFLVRQIEDRAYVRETPVLVY
jgi:putative NADH-flavin reductase